MNCKQGDLAIVTCGPNGGKIVTCLELMPAGSNRINEANGPLWRVDRPMEYHRCRAPDVPAYLYLVPDRALMPIRPEADAIADDDATAHVDNEGAA
jgi:hypothetical protein